MLADRVERWRAVCRSAALAVLLLPAPALAQIYEYVDAEGRVVSYRYTSKKGSVVLTDNLVAIPEEIRKTQKIVRRGVPGLSRPAAEASPAGAAPAANAPPAGAPPPAAAPVPPAQEPPIRIQPPAPPPAAEEGGGGLSTTLLVIGAAALLALAIAGLRLLSGRGGAAARPRAGVREGEPARHESSGDRERRGEDHARPVPRATAPEPAAGDRMEEAVRRYAQAGDFAAAARLSESLGSLDEAAVYHREAGNFARAAELFESLKVWRKAAEARERAGEERRAAELYEAAFTEEGPEAAAVSDSAVRAGSLFEKTGDQEHALRIYLKARLFTVAAPLLERRGDWLEAAECHLKSGDAEKAAECYEKAGEPQQGFAALAEFHYERGRVREAAAFAEQAGDAVRAAEWYQEAGEHARAGPLYLQGGFFNEAAESFLLAGDQAGAAEALEKAGRFLEAAKALAATGAEPGSLAELYERGGEFHAAGRLFIKAHRFDRALAALQRVDPDGEHGRDAALLIGMLFLKQGRADLAREKFLRLIGEQPLGRANLDPYYFLALCHEAAGERERARAIFSKILAEDYGFRDVKARLERYGPPAG